MDACHIKTSIRLICFRICNLIPLVSCQKYAKQLRACSVRKLRKAQLLRHVLRQTMFWKHVWFQEDPLQLIKSIPSWTHAASHIFSLICWTCCTARLLDSLAWRLFLFVFIILSWNVGSPQPSRSGIFEPLSYDGHWVSTIAQRSALNHL